MLGSHSSLRAAFPRCSTVTSLQLSVKNIKWYNSRSNLESCLEIHQWWCHLYRYGIRYVLCTTICQFCASVVSAVLPLLALRSSWTIYNREWPCIAKFNILWQRWIWSSSIELTNKKRDETMCYRWITWKNSKSWCIRSSGTFSWIPIQLYFSVTIWWII
jgi:hypothetical protein